MRTHCGIARSFRLVPILIAYAAQAAICDSFAERSKLLLGWAAGATQTDPKYGFWHVQARLAQGKVQESRTQFGPLLDALHGDDPGFQLWGCMDAYLRWESQLDDPLRTRFRQKMLATPYFDRTQSALTENKELMLAGAAYLARQAWPGAAFASGFASGDPSGRALLLQKMDEYVHRGEREHKSPTYYVFHYGVFRSLADLAVDPEIKAKAAMTAEWLLAAAAPQWLEGHWAASTRRVYTPFRAQNDYAAAIWTLWLMFGGLAPDGPGNEYAFTVQSAVSAYRLPAIIGRIAQDRGREFVHREAHFGDKMTFFSTTFMHPEFSVYSMRESMTQWPRYNDQVQRWGVCWKRPAGKSVFFVLHPTDTKVKDLGATQYERTLQGKGALISVFNIPADDPHPYLIGYIPGNPKEAVNQAASGSVFLDYGSIKVALHLTQGFTWTTGSERFTEPAGKVGMVVEAVAGNSYATLAAFQAVIEPKFAALAWSPAGNPSLAYTALDGTHLELTYAGTDKVNGKAVDFSLATWPLLENPWMSQAYAGDTLTLNHGGEARVYDFRNWSVADKPGTGIRRRVAWQSSAHVSQPRRFLPSGRRIPASRPSGLGFIRPR